MSVCSTHVCYDKTRILNWPFSVACDGVLTRLGKGSLCVTIGAQDRQQNRDVLVICYSFL